MRRLAASRRLQSAEARYGQLFCWLMADMLRPCTRKSDAILRHVASWGDRFPMTVNTAKEALPVNQKSRSANNGCGTHQRTFNSI
jgi:hypothetical protein